VAREDERIRGVITYMTANEVARETGWAMRGWGHGDRLTNDAFAPLETYAERLNALLRRVRELGFDALDLWGAHLSPEWATEEHVALAREALAAHGLRCVTYATWVQSQNVERACELAAALGTTLIGAGFSGEAQELAPVLRGHGVTLAIENHPERTPAEVLAKIDAAGGTMAATVDTGWWATQGYDPVRAIEELGPHVKHVHLKDVLREGEPHETCLWGDGVVDIEACVRALQREGYTGAFTVEHEPEDRDPSEEIASMRAQLEAWLR
jgi:sugar phosphate isomerase/epimerase